MIVATDTFSSVSLQEDMEALKDIGTSAPPTVEHHTAFATSTPTKNPGNPALPLELQPGVKRASLEESRIKLLAMRKYMDDLKVEIFFEQARSDELQT